MVDSSVGPSIVRLDIAFHLGVLQCSYFLSSASMGEVYDGGFVPVRNTTLDLSIFGVM